MASYLTYGLIAWGQVCRLYIHKLLNLQYPALHFIYFPDCNYSAIPLFTHAGVLMLLGCNPPTMNLQLLRQRNAPRSILELFRDISKIQSYKTQSSASNNLYKQSSRLSIQLHSFSRIRKKFGKAIKIKKSLKKQFKKETKRSEILLKKTLILTIKKSIKRSSFSEIFN